MHRDLIVIGASAGGLEALRYLASALPAHLDAAVLVVLHTGRRSVEPLPWGGVLPKILGRAGALPACHPEDGDPIERGHIYIAPPDFHLLVRGNCLRVVRGPAENLHRPAIDPLFRSAAVEAGRRVIGVVLTGMLDDGTSGLMVVRAHGGVAIVQDPLSAMFPSMPRSALRRVPDAQLLPLEQMAAELERLTEEELPGEARLEHHERGDVEPATTQMEDDKRPVHRSEFACPSCGGVLWETEDYGFLRFRCRVGHAFTTSHLDVQQRHAVDTALWSALRALEESAALHHRLANRVRDFGPQSAECYQQSAESKEENARVLRDFLVHVNDGVDDGPTAGQHAAPTAAESPHPSG